MCVMIRWILFVKRHSAVEGAYFGSDHGFGMPNIRCKWRKIYMRQCSKMKEKKLYETLCEKSRKKRFRDEAPIANGRRKVPNHPEL